MISCRRLCQKSLWGRIWFWTLLNSWKWAPPLSFQHLIMKLNSGHVIPPPFSFVLWPTRFHAILITSCTAWNLSDTGFMEQCGWKIWANACLSHRWSSTRKEDLRRLRKHPIPDIRFIHAISLVSGTQSGWKRVQSWRRHFPQLHQPVSRNRIWTPPSAIKGASVITRMVWLKAPQIK